MKQTQITAEQILENFIIITKRLLNKEELSEEDMITINAVILVKDRFVETDTPENMFLDINLNPVLRGEKKVPAYEVRIKMLHEDNTMTLYSNRVIVLGQGTDETRPGNTTVVYCRYNPPKVDTLFWVEMMEGQIQLNTINDGLLYLLFDILPPKEEVKHTLH